jgi:hypothetical protein
MPTINQLTAVDQVVSSDQVPIYSSENGDARKASMATLLAFFSGQITANDDKITQYAAPSATAFNIQLNNDVNSIWLVLTPTGTLAAGTLTLPAVANCVDRQEILVNSTQTVTALTIAGNGATVTGAPTTIAASGFFRLRFDDVTNTWYRVG